jgi:hypothetical protein
MSKKRKKKDKTPRGAGRNKYKFGEKPKER